MKQKACTICKITNKSPRDVNSSLLQKITGKSLKEILETVSGFELNNLDNKKYILCQECMLQLVQTESFISKVRIAFKANSTHDESTVNGTQNSQTEELSVVNHDDSTKKQIEIFKCEVCEYQNRIASRLRTHLANEHNITDAKIYKCPLCSQVFQTKGGRNIHSRWCNHKMTRDFQCPHCDKSFFHHKVLSTHLLRHTKNLAEKKGHNVVKENELPQDDTTTDHIKNVEAVDNIERFECEQCDYNTKSSKKLLKHIKQEHPDEKNAEHLTNKQKKRPRANSTAFDGLTTMLHDDSIMNFSPDNENDYNAIQESKQSRLECNKCNFNTSSIKKLSKHQEAEHKVNKARTSSTPNKKPDKSIDISHISVTDLTTVSSLVCNKNSDKNNSMSKTIVNNSPIGKKAQENNSIHVCLICEKEFSNTKELRTHMRKSHLDDEHKVCPHCGAQFNSTEKLEVHISNEKCKKYAIICTVPQCGRRFESVYKMQKHTTKVHENVDNNSKNKGEDED